MSMGDRSLHRTLASPFLSITSSQVLLGNQGIKYVSPNLHLPAVGAGAFENDKLGLRIQT